MSENNDTHKVLIKALKLKMIEIAKLGVESPKVDSNVRESDSRKIRGREEKSLLSSF